MESFKYNICPLFNIVPMASFSITGTFWIEYTEKSVYWVFWKSLQGHANHCQTVVYFFISDEKFIFSIYQSGDMLLCNQIDFHTDLFMLRGIQIDSRDSMTTLVQKISNNFLFQI